MDTKKRILYTLVALFLVALSLTLFFVYNKKENEVLLKQDEYSFTTDSGKVITVKEIEKTDTTSTVKIQTDGFPTNSEVTLSKNRLSTVVFEDINQDSFKELILTFTSTTEPHYGEVLVFTTDGEEELTSVPVPAITEENTVEGALFEGYAGGDIFIVEDGILLRKFSVTSKVVEEVTEEVETSTREEETVATSTLETVEGFEVGSTTPQNEKEKSITLAQKQVQYVMVFSEGFFTLEARAYTKKGVYFASSTASLLNTSWELVSLSYNKKSSSFQDAALASSLFFGTTTAALKSNCGVDEATYIETGRTIRVGPFASVQPEIIETEVASGTTTEEVAKSPQEKTTCEDILKDVKIALPLAESMIIREEQLMIILQNKKGSLIFKRIN